QGILRAVGILLQLEFERVGDAPTVILPQHWGEPFVVPAPEPGLEDITIHPMPPPALARRGVEEAKRIVNERIAELELFHARRRLEEQGLLAKDEEILASAE